MPSRKRVLFSAGGLLFVVVVLLAVALVYEWWSGAPPTAVVAQVEASYGTYAALAPPQQRLVDDWAARFRKVTGTRENPQDLYDSLALSTRTTFDAVTHALAHTPLTESGQPTKLTALDLIAKIDAVAGSIPGKGGDQQFRLYVQLRPDARQALERSGEFAQQVDNTVYHKGYPICFRSSGGTPSIQFSLARDGTRGDIDVDYRSSAFPIMLINGHLTASNSDVRAGNNDERHNGHWGGLSNWWRGFMGLSFGEAAPRDETTAPGAVAKEPRLGKGAKPAEAMTDFLTAWFVEQDPHAAVGYIAPRAYSCLELENGGRLDRGMAPFQIARAMAAVNKRIGKVSRLADAIEGVTLTGERGRELPHPQRDAFAMYDVREDLASAFDCENTLHPELADAKQAQSTKFGRYFGAVFRIKTARQNGDAVATLWKQENGRWLLVAYDVEPEFRPGVLPSAPAVVGDTSDGAARAIAGDPAMTRAARTFFEAWFVRGDITNAFSYLSTQSWACYNVYRSDDAPEATSAAEAGRLIRDRMEALQQWVGRNSTLEGALAPAEPHHADLKVVKHPGAGAFSLVSVPDAMAAAVDCRQLKRGESPRLESAAPTTSGRFYATSSRLKRAGPDAAVLWTVWSREDRSWKIASFLVVAP